MSKRSLTEEFELSSELSTLVAQGKITPKIAEKIKEKVKKKGVKLTKEQLYKLVDKINSLLRNMPSGNISPNQTAPSQPEEAAEGTESKTVSTLGTPNTSINRETGSVDRFLKDLEELNKRIDRLEKMQTEWMKSIDEKIGMWTGREVNVPGENVKVENAMLDHLPNDPEAVVIVMKWLQYLIDRVGKDSISNVLNYYVDIGWINDDVKSKLLEYCEGITEESKGRKKLVAKDHIQSFLYIQRLKGTNIDEHLMGKIERELNKISKYIENISFQ
ncbi:MAG: hypothetical protein J7K38_02905 [Thermoplasmata archaeon]|nr:hypothetical protein [Thermoplasmata archaeon]